VGSVEEASNRYENQMTPGRKMYWKNAAVAGSFLIPAALLVKVTNVSDTILAFVIGLVWALFFEYSYHRWFQHDPGTTLAKKHAVHHATYQKPDEEEHVNFGDNSMLVALLFIINGLPVLALDFFFLHSWYPGAMLAFVLYFVTMEEVHYRIHMNKWLPFDIGRAHHHRHHRMPPRNFNVFIPLFDYLLGTKEE
jgi:sterol desaturase/sphingolipid hydroxylase (fatty acid hydroxylase superfamily)